MMASRYKPQGVHLTGSVPLADAEAVRQAENGVELTQSLVGLVPVETRVELNGKGLDVTEPATS